MAYRDHPQFTTRIKPMIQQEFINFCGSALALTSPNVPLVQIITAIKNEETLASLQAAPWSFTASKAQAFRDVTQAAAALRTAILTAKSTLET